MNMILGKICILIVFSLVFESKSSFAVNGKEVDAGSQFTTPPVSRKREREAGYENVMKFGEGDFLFGLTAQRGSTTEFLRARHEIITIDQLNKLFEESDNLPGEYRKLNDRERTAKIHQIIAEWYQHNADIKYNPKVLKRYFDFLFDHEDYSPAELKGVRNKDLKLKRACKAAILFAQKEGKKIHFLLDGMDMDLVLHPQFQKSQSEKGAGSATFSFYESFTSTELRFIYRLWLKDPSILNTVVFYKNGRVVGPPWPASAKDGSWENYSPQFAKDQAYPSGGCAAARVSSNPGAQAEYLYDAVSPVLKRASRE